MGLPAFQAGATLSTLYPEPEALPVTISQETISQLEERLKTVRRTEKNSFHIIDTLSGAEETVSTDYTVPELGVKNGVATVTAADAQLLEEKLNEAGLGDATDAQKLAWAVEWIHNEVTYAGYHTGDYVYSAFEEAGGQCNIYNGALCALAVHLGYEVQMIRGYRGSSGSRMAHWWGELICEDGSRLVLEAGNITDGAWYYLGATYEETHGPGRDYIKCGKYAYNNEIHEYVGAVAYLWGEEVTIDKAVLTGRIWKGEDYDVTEVGLLLGENESSMQQVASDTVNETYNTANEKRGFSASYDLSEYNLELKEGESYTYAFYAVVDGVTCVGNSSSFTVPTAQTEQEEQPSQGATQKPEVWPLAVLGAGAVVAGLFLQKQRLDKARKKARRKRRRKEKEKQQSSL